MSVSRAVYAKSVYLNGDYEQNISFQGKAFCCPLIVLNLDLNKVCLVIFFFWVNKSRYT